MSAQQAGPDWLAIYGASLSTVIAIAGAARGYYGWRHDRHKVSTGVRYVPAIHSYIIEAANVGRCPVTLVAAGLSHYPEGLYNRSARSWPADGDLPKRLDERDTDYFQVRLSGEDAERQPPTYAWVRDASGKTYRVGITGIAEPTTGSSAPIMSEVLPAARLAQLYNLEVQQEDILETKARLAYLEAEVETYRELARLRHERDERKQRDKSEAGTNGKPDGDNARRDGNPTS